ncbi:YkgJ family cysteine cluster protein [Shewanella maritima]|uniref:YkgJ family cysteine cluster protein n=1 Tax=Shewanella maritima TaxID=2520507 RepID=A0A411PLB7_9GAMM|nr:YkgJ family cysteine cluster protein [Shewanella maritima]QBF84309.1 YkgJ family cysteine cluster protein [Shewanella maritima]
MLNLNERERLEVQSIFVATEKEYRKRLRANKNSVYAINLVGDLHNKIDSVISSVKKKGIKFGCRKGCSYCCDLRVEVLAPEVFYITKKLKGSMSKSEMQAFIEKLMTYADKATGLRFDEHIIPCVMLENGACSIYEYRPMMCRKYNSLDAQVCEDPHAQVPENTEVVVKTGAIGKGFSDSYESRGLSAIPHELGQALLVALTDPKSEQKWAKGNEVFTRIPEMN